MKKREINFHQQFEEIFKSQQDEIEKLANGFDFVLTRVLEDSAREMELLRALGDEGGLVKEQIKHSTIEHALEVFGECYLRTTGDRWGRRGS